MPTREGLVREPNEIGTSHIAHEVGVIDSEDGPQAVDLTVRNEPLADHEDRVGIVVHEILAGGAAEIPGQINGLEFWQAVQVNATKLELGLAFLSQRRERIGNLHGDEGYVHSPRFLDLFS